MKIARLLALVAVLGTVGLLASCKKADPAADRAAIESLVRSDTVHYAGGTTHDSTGTGFLTEGDTAFIWWRGAQTHDSAPDIVVSLTGDSAMVMWSNHNYGWFNVVLLRWGEPAIAWAKPLRELVRLSAVYVREGAASDDDRGWRFRRISLAAGLSDSVNTVRIDSLRIQSSLQNSVIRDPLTTFYRGDSLVSFTPGELVTLTLYTNATEGMAFLHTFVLVWPFYLRLNFEPQGDGVFAGTWHAQGWPSFRFAIFDLMARSTVYSETGAYDFNGWLFPYRIQTAR
jgi:hypothetical protein